MIRVELGSDTLARTRFALSPLHQAVTLLYHLKRAPAELPQSWRVQAERCLRDRRLSLLATVGPGGPHGYVPDFLTPEPLSFEPDLTSQLHHVATTPVERVRYEMASAIGGHPWRTDPGPAPSAPMTTALRDGEESLAEHLADELEQFWHHVFAPRWPQLRDQLENDIAVRSDMIARLGFAGMVRELSPTIEWRDGGLDLHIPYHGYLVADAAAFVPAAFTRRALHTVDAEDAPGRRPLLISYPVLTARVPQAQSADDLIGATRTRVLAELTEPISTGELAQRLELSPSTVSYHLQILNRAGLTRRSRRDQVVLYQRTR
jgi:DNA-binding transcriptional ArsR family regulator